MYGHPSNQVRAFPPSQPNGAKHQIDPDLGINALIPAINALIPAIVIEFTLPRTTMGLDDFVSLASLTTVSWLSTGRPLEGIDHGQDDDHDPFRASFA